MKVFVLEKFVCLLLLFLKIFEEQKNVYDYLTQTKIYSTIIIPTNKNCLYLLTKDTLLLLQREGK